ncbi:MAG: flavin reductase family protein [Alphaproteobacteria bacterium]
MEKIKPVDQRSLRNALGCFATGVTVITGCGVDGSLLGFTANSFNSVSLEPPLVLFSLDKRANSLGAFFESHHFAVNVLADDQRALSGNFARPHPDKWNNIAYTTWETGCPILIGALASFECHTRERYDGGDHVIFVGEVQHMATDPSKKPLLYFRGAYGKLSPEAH